MTSPRFSSSIPILSRQVPNIQKKNENPVSNKQTISDWYIPEDAPEKSSTYPGPVSVTGETLNAATSLLRLAVHACYLKDLDGRLLEILSDYRIEFMGRHLRGHRQRTVDGILHILRATPSRTPDSRNLGLPEAIRNLLCNSRFMAAGGLVIVCGQPGHGKSTTCASIVLERVKAYGSFCLTVEDPPEFPLSGEYLAHGDAGPGKIIQVHASAGGFACALRDALRCYPSNVKGSMLLVGEVRDADSAVQVLRAAATGQLVFMTTHAGDPILAIERLLSLANGEINDTKEAAALLASCLRAVVHQRLQSGELTVSALFSASSDSAVAAVIRKNEPRLLSTELARQQVLLSNGMLESYLKKNDDE